jgi:hypothetical protein
MGDRTVFGQDLKSKLSGSSNDLPTSSIDIPLTVLDEEIEYDQPTFICELRIELSPVIQDDRRASFKMTRDHEVSGSCG